MSDLEASQGDTGASEETTITPDVTTDATDVTTDVTTEETTTETTEESGDSPVLPESADGYVFTPPEGMKDVDQESYDSFREFAFNQKMSQEHFQAILEFSAKRDKSIIDEYETTLEEGREAVRAEMGDKLESNLQKVKEVMQAAGQEVPENDNDILDNPALMKFILWTAEKIGQDNLGTATGHGSAQGEPSAEAVLFGDMFNK